ncbi:MAG TPA: FecR domain-containing protein, partial [Thermodesulfobacteriota bacterium]
GEAYFEVAADPRRPFEVVSGPATIRVAGTAFSAHRDGGRVRVAVRRGEVAVRHEGVGPEVLLRAGEALEVTAAGPSRRQAVDPDEAFDWLDGRIRFRRRPLGEVLDELRRHLRGWIVVADGRLAAVEVSGSYRLDDPAAVVASLADVAGARLLRLSDHLLVLY